MAAGVGGFGKFQPIALGLAVFAGDNFTHVAGFESIVHTYHAVVDTGADVMVANIGMNGVGKINGGGTFGQ